MSNPREQTGTLLCADGTRLFYREWLVDAPRAIVHIVHGLGEHSGRYAHVAARLNALRIGVRAHDQRGHGRSEGARGALRHSDDFLEDLRLVLEDFAHQQGATPFLLGHSLGGLVAARFATGGYAGLRGLILSSPALAISLSGGQRLQLAIGSRLLPSLAANNGINADNLSHDPTVVAAYRADPLNHARVTPRLVQFMVSAGERARHDAENFHGATLMLVAGSDRLVDASGSREFFERLPGGNRTMRWYDDAYHEIFNETAERRARVFDDLSIWLDAHIAK
jgi:alpha-beta hydrolase superfamily lysophospholipase